MKKQPVDKWIGPRIKDTANVIWKLGLAVDIIAVIVSTVVYANSGSYYSSPSGDDVFVFFLISALIGVVSLIGLYVLKILMEGFGELILTAQSIEQNVGNILKNNNNNIEKQ